MVTKENFSHLYKTLKAETRDSINDLSFFEEDFVLFESHFFNAGGYATIKSIPYSGEIEKQAQQTGQLFCDGETFYGLCVEMGVIN